MVASEPADSTRTLTNRVLIIGTVASATVGIIAPWAIHVLRGSYMALDFSTPLAIALLFVLALGLRLLRRKSEGLAVVYVMMLVASAIPTLGLVSQLTSLTTGTQYYATPENKWAESILPNLPTWALPHPWAVTGFYEGLSQKVFIPWGDWILCLAAWLPFLVCLYAAMIASMVLLHGRWADNEHLPYPLVQLPLEMIKGTIFSKWIFWIGFVIPVVAGSLTGLHHYWSSVPVPQLASQLAITTKHTVSLELSFPMMGFFYLAGLDATLSLWLFSLVGQLSRAGMVELGVTMTEKLGIFGASDPATKYLGTGAFIALVGVMLWTGRTQLVEAWHRRPIEAWAIKVGFAGMVCWLVLSGLPIWVAPVLVLMAFVFFLGLTRIVAEVGMGEAVAPSIAPVSVAGCFGYNALGSQGIAALSLSHVWCSDPRTFVMASVANSLKIVGAERKKLYRAFALAIGAALLTSLAFTLWQGYSRGALNMDTWFFQGAPRAQNTWAAEWMRLKPGPSVTGWFIIIAGAAIYWVLAVWRFKGYKWAVSPIGFCIGNTWIMDHIWATAFVTWFVKRNIFPSSCSTDAKSSDFILSSSTNAFLSESAVTAVVA